MKKNTFKQSPQPYPLIASQFAIILIFFVSLAIQSIEAKKLFAFLGGVPILSGEEK